MERVGGDAALLQELVRLFLDTFPGNWPSCALPLARRDESEARCAAHTLKGAVGTLGARATYESALVLEGLILAGQLDEAEQACAAVEQAIGELRPVLTAATLSS